MPPHDGFDDGKVVTLRAGQPQTEPPFAEADSELPAREYIDDEALRRSNIQWTSRLIYFGFAVVEILIGLRVLLKLIAANNESLFTKLIYGLTAPFIAPFQNIVKTPAAKNGATLDASSLLAIFVYILLSWIVVRLFQILKDRPTVAVKHETVEGKSRIVG